MLYWLSHSLQSYITFFNVFRYISFRTLAALLTAFLINLIWGKAVIRWLKSFQRKGQPIRNDGPESHLLTKQGTPTMGGIMILSSLLLSVLLWNNLANPLVLLLIFVAISFGMIGAYDDYLKLLKSNHKGISAKTKFIFQTVFSLVFLFLLQKYSPDSKFTSIAIPFTRDYFIDIGSLFFLWGCIVIIGSSNAVNLTDGLDGLAIGPTIIAAGCFTIICYCVGNAKFASYLQLHPVPNAGEITVFLGALMGSGLGFLWYNTPPARVFMGDTGSLSVGALFGAMAVMVKHELVLLIVGGLFAIEACSVILQVAYYKKTKKRIFLMAPIHHHFEKKGWSEPTIVIRFWIIAIVLGIIGLSTLKIR
ncbi:MAG: phospho-N-acetylmuramoyl-pentapeptide-transferase [Candidatus Puniceispirillum sp.]|nr:phospho-N-acetylmuramoyl-pentapeptide-transferase [Candidatus Pelagibacter sp.]MBA4282670.1 phospho-N-acetylmuramoyl-pentapeptide-transferase [Candidatus Puniceispirillum sp.]